MVRECRPPASEPGRSWLARRSTIATSTPANASSPASISPVGPPPAITTACSVIATPRWLGLEAVADAADCEDCRAAGGIDLAAEPRDVGLEPEQVRVGFGGPTGADESKVRDEVAAGTNEC